MNKRELRKKYLPLRRGLDHGERNRADKKICRLLERLPELKRSAKIVAFISDGSEPNLMPLLQQIAQHGKRIFLPRFAVNCNAEYELVETTLRPASLVTGKYGIAEPVATLPATNDALNDALWLLPGVAFDMTGRRVGRGKGIYDRLLSQSGATAVGVFYACQKAVKVPTEEHDYSLDIIITEAGISRINNGEKE